jgi:hypothetical protein
MNTYKDSAFALKDVNLQDIGILFDVDWSKLDVEKRNALSDYEGSLVDIAVVDENELWEVSTYFATDEDERDELLDGLIKDAPHYLVMAHNCRWNGTSGYKFAHRKEEILYRGYNTSIYPVDASKGGKVLICNEFSHDVPMGATTSIIALTENEYDMLDNASFEQVETFVRRMEARV